MKKTLALNVNGELTYCTSPPELRGHGRCNHVAHQEAGESPEDFVKRIGERAHDDGTFDCAAVAREITQEEVDQLAKQIDEIAGCKVTKENFREVMADLSPEQIDEISKIGFNAAPVFSLPIREEEYEDTNVKNKLYFTNLHKYGVGGSTSAITQMFDKVGQTPTHNGEMVDVKHSYAQGLTEREYFAKQYYARIAMITKGVGTSKPGYCISRNSQVGILEDGQLESVFWSDINVGDQFEDGSVVEEIRDWQEKQCVTLKVMDCLPVTVSYDHLVLADIIIAGERVENLAASKRAREAIGENDNHWVCAEDILLMHQHGAKILLSTQRELLDVVDAGVEVVRCISTDTGFYETNGMVHHNTARKLFYAVSDTQVMSDCGGPYVDAMHCKLPNGHVCVHCAHMTKGGEVVREGQLVGGVISTNLSEGLTQASMELKHPIWENQEVDISRKGKTLTISWSELELGDQFPNGALVLDITDWDLRVGYRMVASGAELVCSDTHLVMADVYDKNGQRMNGQFEVSKEIRNDVGAGEDDSWVCAEELMEAVNQGHEVDIATPYGAHVPLESIERFGAEPIRVRCITTNTGVYDVGPFLSHNTGTMASMSKQSSAAIIMATLDGWGTSPIVQEMREAHTTEEMRKILYEGLKRQYEESNIKQDDFNLQMIAKKMTSYKRDKNGLRPVEEGERADVVSIGAVGNANNIFKAVELSSGYGTLTRPVKQRLDTDAANQIIN